MVIIKTLLLFGVFLTWICCVESKISQNDVESMYQAMSDRISTLEAALLHHPAEIEKLRQEFRTEIDLLKKQHGEQISGLRQEIVALRLEHGSQIQELKQLVLSSGVENVDRQENGNISTDRMPAIQKNEGQNNAENRILEANQTAASSIKTKGSSKAGITKRQLEVGEQVAFFAKLSGHSLNMGTDQVIIFQNCVTNIGNAYDSHIGVFKAPRPGVYLFSTTITAFSRNKGHIRIFINNVPETEFYLNGGQNAWDESSQTIIVRLKRGDDVTVRSKDMGHGVSGGHIRIFINDVPETEFYLNGGQNAWDESSQTIIVRLKRGDDVTVRSKDMGHGVSGGHIRIFINDVPETEFYLNGGQNAWDESSQTIIVSLKRGDDVTVRSKDVGHGVNGGSFSVFSGVLLFEDFSQGLIVG